VNVKVLMGGMNAVCSRSRMCWTRCVAGPAEKDAISGVFDGDCKVKLEAYLKKAGKAVQGDERCRPWSKCQYDQGKQPSVVNDEQDNSLSSPILTVFNKSRNHSNHQLHYPRSRRQQKAEPRL
jgi:hypothetical protein